VTPSIPSSSPTSGTTAASSSSTSPSSTAEVNEDTFLQLLVAELENQDPTNPTDSTEFVTQLAEFQELTTTMGMATSITDIQQDTDQLVTLAGGTPSDAQTGTSSTSGTQS
jgi:flagellar basal-body rod modification protein FlgD